MIEKAKLISNLFFKTINAVWYYGTLQFIFDKLDKN